MKTRGGVFGNQWMARGTRALEPVRTQPACELASGLALSELKPTNYGELPESAEQAVQQGEAHLPQPELLQGAGSPHPPLCL